MTKHHDRISEHQGVTVAKPLAPNHGFVVDEGAVVRQPVVADGPVLADSLELRVQAGNLGVPRQRDVSIRPPAHTQAGPGRRELQHPLLSGAVAVDQNGSPWRSASRRC